MRAFFSSRRGVGPLCATLLCLAEPALPQSTELYDTTPDSSAQAPFAEDRVARGRAIAKGGAARGGVQMKCMACHGLQGHGDGTVPRLAGLPYDYLARQITSFLDGSRPHEVMTPIASYLEAGEAADVLAYYASRETPDIDPPRDLDWELASAGEVLAYAGRQMPKEGGGPEVTACVMCHHAVGELDDKAIAPPLAGQPAAYIEAQLEAWKTGDRRGGPLGTMSQIAKSLTEEEMAAVAAFYASRNPAESESE